MIYISFINEQQQELTHLHTQGIKRADADAKIIYISKDPLKTPNGTLNIYGIDITQQGYKSFLSLLTTLKLLGEQHNENMCLTSVTTIFRNNIKDAWQSNKCKVMGFMNNTSVLPLKSVFCIHLDIVKRVIDYLSQKQYWDLFNRDAMEVLQGLALIVADASEVKLFQCVMPNGDAALFGFYNGMFYTNTERLNTVYLCVECDNLPYLQGYLQAHLDIIAAIKRAMQHCLHVWNKRI